MTYDLLYWESVNELKDTILNLNQFYFPKSFVVLSLFPKKGSGEMPGQSDITYEQYVRT